MKALALLLALTACQPVPAIERDGTLSDDDKATLLTCTAANPCAVWSEAEVRAVLVLYRARLMESGVMCKRDAI